MKDKKQGVKLNNGGFSLVELVVVMALICIIGTAIYAFLGVSLNTYRKDAADINIQTQAQMASSQLENMILSASNGVCYNLSTDPDSGVSTSMLQLFSFDFDTKTRVREKVYKNQEDSFLYFVREENKDGSWNVVDTTQLFATYIKDFDVIIYDDLGKDITGSTDSEAAKQVEVRFSYSHGGREYQETRLVTLRNRIILNSDEEKIFEDVNILTTPSVRQVFISLNQDGRLWVDREYTGLFNADMFGKNIDGLSTGFDYGFGNPLPSDAGTTITSDGNRLNIALGERNNFEVLATSQASTSLGAPKSAGLKIYPRYIEGASIIGFVPDVDAKEANFTINVVVHNGTGDEVERNEIMSVFSQRLINKKNGNLTGKLHEITYKSVRLTRDSASYVFTVDASVIPPNNDVTYYFTVDGFGYTGTVSTTFKIRDISELRGNFEVYSNALGPGGASVYPGQTFDIYGTFKIEDDEAGVDLNPIRPTEFVSVTVTEGANLLESTAVNDDGRFSVKKMKDITTSDRTIKFNCSYKYGKFTYNYVYAINLTPIEVTVRQPYKGTTIPLNVDAGVQGRELLPYMCTAKFNYRMPDIAGATFKIQVSCPDTEHITINGDGAGTWSSISFDRLSGDNNDVVFQSDTEVIFDAIMSLIQYNGTRVEFDTGAEYVMKLTIGKPDVFVSMVESDWNKIGSINVAVWAAGTSRKPVFGLFVPTDLYGGRYLPEDKFEEVNRLYPATDISKSADRTAYIQRNSRFYNLLVEYELPMYWENGHQYFPHYTVRTGGEIPGNYRNYSHNVVAVYDFYDNNDGTPLLDGGANARAGLANSSDTNYNVKVWYESLGN
ncbi:MAG: prepilin-type N-terminal cleavage/methylation domain-containing protein [Pseudobutyrivibrio sp.]|nr:prepilin-type N-terminal cleavage/methylation domain-containing protein [Pseudobutyrivibrio sp.]